MRRKLALCAVLAAGVVGCESPSSHSPNPWAELRDVESGQPRRADPRGPDSRSIHAHGTGFVASSCAADTTLKSLSCTSIVHAVGGGGVPVGGVQVQTVPSLSPGGTLLSFGASIANRVSGEHFELIPSQGQLSATAFAPNGDILAGDSEGRLHRFCVRR